jgi:hypothetical protein
MRGYKCHKRMCRVVVPAKVTHNLWAGFRGSTFVLLNSIKKIDNKTT